MDSHKPHFFFERFLDDDNVYGLEFSSHTQTIPHKTLIHSLTHIQSDGLSYRVLKIEIYIYREDGHNDFFCKISERRRRFSSQIAQIDYKTTQ